jgi:NAD(P)-dependent dehydrogenase (short-subunit alcohol dehydrogenase family)
MVVVITGASAGIGRAVARAFGRRGARVGLIARDRDRLEATRGEVESLGGRAVCHVADVAQDAQVEASAIFIEEQLGPIDVWINNAIASVFGPAQSLSAAEYRRVTDVTYLGYVWGTLAALRRMRTRNRGVIVQVGASQRAMPLQSACSAAKHAVRGFTESLRLELRHDGSRIRLVMVELPAANTPLFDWSRSKMGARITPVSPIYEPEVLANWIEHAALHPRDDVVVHWPMAWRGLITSEPDDSVRADNLFAPVRGDHGAHGSYGGRARRRSVGLWMSMHSGALAFGVASASALTVLSLLRLRA